MTKQQVKAGIYVRVSMDRDGTSESPERQLVDCRALAEAKGFTIVDIYEDRLSAYSKRVRRPEFERLLQDVRDGRVDTVVFWKLDRLTRQGFTGLTPLVELGVQLVSVNEAIDTTTPMGEGVAALLASVAKEESRGISLRVKRAHQAAAEDGRMHSGGSRAYGYTHDGEVVHEEAKIIEEVARRALDGESWHSIAADLERRELRTSTGRTKWHPSRLAALMRNPLLAGFRTHNGDTPSEGRWRPILDVDTHRRLVATRNAPRALRKPYHLLAGIIYCKLCGGRMKTMGFRMHNGKPFERYQCVKSPGQINCGKVAITKKSTDEDVKDRLFGVLSSGELEPGRGSTKLDEVQLRRTLVEDGQRLERLAHARFVDDEIDHKSYLAARAKLEKRVKETETALVELKQQRDQVKQARGLRPGKVEDLEAWWVDADDHERRDAVHAAVNRIVVKPAKHRGGNRYDPGRVRVDFNWKVLQQVAARADPDADESEAIEINARAMDDWLVEVLP